MEPNFPSTLAALNRADRPTFVATLSPVFETPAGVADELFEQRPFADLAALKRSIMEVVRRRDEAAKLAFLEAHPELAGREALAGTMTEASTGEQGRLGLTRLSHDEFARISRVNQEYRERFGFPCIVALRRHETRHTVIAEMEHRLANSRETEIENALQQIGHIIMGRLEQRFGG